MPANMPFDFQSQQSSIDRKRKMAEALISQFSTPQQGQMVSGHYVAPNAVQSLLGPALGMMAGQKLGEGFDAEQKGLGERYRSELSQGLEGYFKTREGNPSPVMDDAQAGALMNDDQAPNLEPVPGDPRRAAVGALTSQFPELQALGKQDFAAMGKPNDETFGTSPAHLQDPTGKLVAALIGNKGTVRPLNGYAPQQESFSAPFQRDGDWYQKDSRGKEFKLDNAPKTTVTVDNRQGVQKGVGEYYKATGESIAPGGKSNVAAAGAQEALNSSAEALQAVNDGARQGIAQPALQVLRKIGAELGMPDSETAPTDALTASLKASVFKDLGGLGAQISDGDRKFVMEFSGDLATDPMALKRMLAIRMAAQIKKVNTHNKVVASFANKADDPTIEGEAGLPLNITIPDDEVSNMVQNVLTGKPTTHGMPQYQVSGKGKPAAVKPTVSNW